MSVVQWGTVSEWVAGIATVGALYWAIHFGSQESRRRREEHARGVAAWISGNGGVTVRDGQRFQRLNVIVKNGGTEPVMNAEVQVYNKRREDERLAAPLRWTVLPPASNDDRWVEVPVTEKTEGHRSFVVSIEITDVAGVRWAREPDGRIRRLKSPKT